jgi:predicted secreted protein
MAIEKTDLTVGQIITVEKDANLTTGYAWRLVRLEKFALLDAAFRYDGDSALPGRPGKSSWVLQAIEEGNGAIQFAKYRSFDLDTILFDDVLPYTIGKAAGEASQKPGGWSAFKALEGDDEKIFKSAVPPVGVGYTPLLVARQVVNGINLVFLANAKVAAQDAREYAVAVRVFAKDGVVERKDIRHIGRPSGAGAFGAFKPLSSEGKAAFKEAFEHYAGLDFKPEYEAVQTVAGRNYLFAGNGNAVVKDAATRPLLVKVYQPLKGPARITGVEDAVEL